MLFQVGRLKHAKSLPPPKSLIKKKVSKRGSSFTNARLPEMPRSSLQLSGWDTAVGSAGSTSTLHLPSLGQAAKGVFLQVGVTGIIRKGAGSQNPEERVFILWLATRNHLHLFLFSGDSIKTQAPTAHFPSPLQPETEAVGSQLQIALRNEQRTWESQLH